MPNLKTISSKQANTYFEITNSKTQSCTNNWKNAMKLLLVALLFNLSTQVMSQHHGSHDQVRKQEGHGAGYAITGEFTVSGIVKSALRSSAIPLGGYSSFYGYETHGFHDSTPTFCYGGVGLSTNGTILGAAFGGVIEKTYLAGKCEKPADYLGGFLTFEIGYDVGDGKTKEIGLDGSINLGFDLEKFNKTLIDNFHTYSLSERNFRTRMKDASLHLIKYIARSSQKQLGENYIWLKLLTLPLGFIVNTEQLSKIGTLNFNSAEVSKLKSLHGLSTLKSDIINLVNKIKNDPKFYQCSGSSCLEIYNDSLLLLDTVEKSLGECHSYAMTINLATSLAINLPNFEPKLSFGVSYSYFGLDSETTEKINPKVQVLKTFSLHNFRPKSKSCKKVEEKAAESFGVLLSILGVGSK